MYSKWAARGVPGTGEPDLTVREPVLAARKAVSGGERGEGVGGFSLTKSLTWRWSSSWGVKVPGAHLKRVYEAEQAIPKTCRSSQSKECLGKVGKVMDWGILATGEGA